MTWFKHKQTGRHIKVGPSSSRYNLLVQSKDYETLGEEAPSVSSPAPEPAAQESEATTSEASGEETESEPRPRSRRGRATEE